MNIDEQQKKKYKKKMYSIFAFLLAFIYVLFGFYIMTLLKSDIDSETKRIMVYSICFGILVTTIIYIVMVVITLKNAIKKMEGSSIILSGDVLHISTYNFKKDVNLKTVDSFTIISSKKGDLLSAKCKVNKTTIPISNFFLNDSNNLLELKTIIGEEKILYKTSNKLLTLLYISLTILIYIVSIISIRKYLPSDISNEIVNKLIPFLGGIYLLTVGKYTFLTLKNNTRIILGIGLIIISIIPIAIKIF